jgi:tetratricopeptide (TPR) repeat protein
MQRGHVGYACLEIGAYADAERHLRDALEAADRLGLSNVVATAKHNLGRALMHRGELAEAQVIEQQAFEEFELQVDRRLAGAARVYLSYILLERGELDRAHQELELALATAQTPMRPQILASIARVLLVQGEIAEAVRLSREASAVLDEVGSIEEGENLVRLMLVETRLAAGDIAGARDAAEIAYARLVERARRISDPTWRTSFLANIPEHQRTRELAASLGVATTL